MDDARHHPMMRPCREPVGRPSIPRLCSEADSLFRWFLGTAQLRLTSAPGTPLVVVRRRFVPTASAVKRVFKGRMLQADDEAALHAGTVALDEFAAPVCGGSRPRRGAPAGSDGHQGVFAVRGQQLALLARATDLTGELYETTDASFVLEDSVSDLLATSRAQSSDALGLAVRSFDQGRLLLTAISVVSVIAATLAAWLWVGNGMVRRLSRLSERMRGMADGDLETPVSEVGQDEIGELAGALEVFRQQALEVQRLNLVEQLNDELRRANAELQRMQARLVAQEKLAALGQLVSGVAHEISNPLNFVKNFSESSLELHTELSEMLEKYRDKLEQDDTALLTEITEELTQNLNRVWANGGRALAIVERMRGLGVVGGELALTDLNSVLQQAGQAGCIAHHEEGDDFIVQPVFDLDPSLGEVPLVERDFSEAVLNLVSNACYAMRLKRQAAGDSYGPVLAVSSRLVDDMVEVRVRDNGPGIPDNVVGNIFDPFFSTRDGALGAGLGLSIAADVARRLGGELTVDTVFGEYAEFTMSLPARSKARRLWKARRLGSVHPEWPTGWPSHPTESAPPSVSGGPAVPECANG